MAITVQNNCPCLTAAFNATAATPRYANEKLSNGSSATGAKMGMATLANNQLR
jgi:hypothetical protein